MTKEKIKRKVGRPSNAELKYRKDEAEKDKIVKVVSIIGVLLLFGILSQALLADRMTHTFKSPSFSGENTSSHYLTIDNVEYTRKMSIKAEIKALQDQIERDKENTTLARFIRNLESRIYAQLSRQLVEALFGETPSDNGTIELEGNTITYTVLDGIITLTIVDADGNETIIQIPIGSFTF
tara:strand:- start:5817 stop:6359 length:543 start_codon:yes stop_codon:yes gene_type:complete